MSKYLGMEKYYINLLGYYYYEGFFFFLDFQGVIKWIWSIVVKNLGFGVRDLNFSVYYLVFLCIQWDNKSICFIRLCMQCFN